MKLFYLFLALMLCIEAVSAQSKSPNKGDTTAANNNKNSSSDVGAVHKTGDETITGRKIMSYIDADTLHFTDLSPLNFGSILKDGSYSRFRWSQPASGLSRHMLSLNTSADNILWNAKYKFSGHPREGLTVQGRIDVKDYSDPVLGLIRGTLETRVFSISGLVNSIVRPVSAGLNSYYFFTDSVTNNLILSQNNKELGLKFSNISRNRQFTFPDTTGTLITGLGTNNFIPKWSGPNTVTNAIAGVDYVIPDTLLNYMHLTTRQSITGSKTFIGLTKIDSLDFSSPGNYQYIKTGNPNQFHRWKRDNTATAFRLESTRDAGITWLPGFSQSLGTDAIPTNTLANLIANGYVRIANKEYIEITAPTASNFVLVLDTTSNLNIRRIPTSMFALNAGVVHISGDELVAGIKTFSSSPVVPNATNDNQAPNFGQLNAGLELKANKTITVNGQPLSANVTLVKADVGLSNADNTSDANKPVSIAAQLALNLKADKSITVNGQPLSANVTLLKGDVGLNNADNTSDANKPVSIASQSALNLKADKSITVNGQPLSANVTLLKSDVGLSNADNTSDANKPVSIATHNILNIKADKATTLAGYGITDGAINSNVVHISGDESISGVKIFNGNIGIGTSNPGSYRLVVKGTIKTQAIKVDPSNWADYVFAKTYKLPALSEVEKFIQANHHLPEIPSDADVKKNGIELGDMNALLLKKIEELTLYMIQKDKEVKELRNRLNELESKR